MVVRWEPSPTLPAHLELEAQLPCIVAGVRFQIQCKLQGSACEATPGARTLFPDVTDFAGGATDLVAMPL